MPCDDRNRIEMNHQIQEIQKLPTWRILPSCAKITWEKEEVDHCHHKFTITKITRKRFRPYPDDKYKIVTFKRS